MKKNLFAAVVIWFTAAVPVFSQSFSINTDGSTAHASAMLDIKSTVKGLLLPRMTSVQRTAIASPANGLQVYDTDLNLLYFYNGSTWSALGSGTNYWTTSGGKIYNNTGNYVGIGNSTPSAKLHVGAGTRFGVLDTGAVFLQSGNTIGSARDWKIYVSLPIGYLSFRDMGFDNLNNGMGTDAMVIQYITGNVGIGAATPSARLDVGADFKLGAAGSVNNAVLKTTQNIDIGTIAANGELDVTVTVANAVTGNSAVFLSPNADINSGLIIAWARVSAPNTVKIRFRNATGAPIDPAPANYVISVLQ